MVVPRFPEVAAFWRNLARAWRGVGTPVKTELGGAWLEARPSGSWLPVCSRRKMETGKCHREGLQCFQMHKTCLQSNLT